MILGAEALIGFLPVLIFFFIAAVGIPAIVGQAITGPNRLMSIMLFSWFALGLCGVIGMYLLIDYIFIEKPKSFKSIKRAYVLCFLGVVAVSIFGYVSAQEGTVFVWIAALPVIVMLHFSNVAYRSFHEGR